MALFGSFGVMIRRMQTANISLRFQGLALAPVKAHLNTYRGVRMLPPVLRADDCDGSLKRLTF